ERGLSGTARVGRIQCRLRLRPSIDGPSWCLQSGETEVSGCVSGNSNLKFPAMLGHELVERPFDTGPKGIMAHDAPRITVQREPQLRNSMAIFVAGVNEHQVGLTRQQCDYFGLPVITEKEPPTWVSAHSTRCSMLRNVHTPELAVWWQSIEKSPRRDATPDAEFDDRPTVACVASQGLDVGHHVPLRDSVLVEFGVNHGADLECR